MGRPPALTASGRHRTDTGDRRGLACWKPESARPPRAAHRDARPSRNEEPDDHRTVRWPHVNRRTAETSFPSEACFFLDFWDDHVLHAAPVPSEGAGGAGPPDDRRD